MHSIIQFVGGLISVAGVIIVVFGIMMMVTDRAPGADMVGLSIAAGGLGTILSGAILYCFGAIVEHLIAIRRQGEEQLRIFQQRLGSQ